ncbi:unnamed protein product [Fasciola hepatica]|uniref:Uncharacterized protein n=1 Tax=Fasciola hepatica TaxID=6192 RepID=A0ABC9HJE2_FASHE|nr:unnamed protein product [Fasciola hepatica]
MASSLYKSRPIHLAPCKLYGYKIIDWQTQLQLIERLSRPTISVLQAQIHAAWQNANQLRNKSVPLKTPLERVTVPVQQIQSPSPTSPSVGKPLNSDVKPFTIKILGDDSMGSKPSARSADTKSTDTHDSSTKLVDLQSITDYHLVSVPLNNLNLQWTREVDLSSVHPPCTCPRGEALFRAEMDRWTEAHDCGCSVTRPSTPYSTCTHFQTRDPVDWPTVRRIVRRLNDNQTIASAIRRKENSRRKRRSPINPMTAPIQLGGVSKNDYRVQSPRTRPSLFNMSGQFKTQTYVGRFQREHQLGHDLNRLSRPTTASSFKQRGRCPICDQSPGERTVFGVEYSGFAVHETNRLRDREEEIRLVERVSRPTFSHSADHIRCKRSREWMEAPTGPLAAGTRVYLSGEAIVQRITQSAKFLPLLSGLPRSSSVNSITRRLYSGKCSRPAKSAL